MKRSLVIFFSLACFCSIAQKVETGEIVDSRDGKKYKTVTVDIILAGDVTIKRTWMAQNMNYDVPESDCYKDEPAYCEAYGRLYTFNAARQACPEGWHIPTIGEWELLFSAFGGIREAGTALQKGGQSQMDLILGGFGDPGSVYKNIGISGNYWDAEKKSENTAGLISVQKDGKEIYHSAIGNWHKNSLRCIKDY